MKSVLVTTITIERRLFPSGEDATRVVAETPDGDRPPLVEVLGLLELSKDSIIRQYMEKED